MTASAEGACSIASGRSCGPRCGLRPAQQLKGQTLNNQPSPAAMILFMTPICLHHTGEKTWCDGADLQADGEQGSMAESAAIIPGL